MHKDIVGYRVIAVRGNGEQTVISTHKFRFAANLVARLTKTSPGVIRFLVEGVPAKDQK
jgi:hypothetical protein